jgi:LemA protein
VDIYIIIGMIAAVIAVVLIAWFVSIYNRFFSLRNSAESTLGQARVAMKKRLDMIDQLLGAVKSYATFEKETLERVTQMRSTVGNASAKDMKDMDSETRSILGRVYAVAESYPDLKTSLVVKDLTGAVTELENEIARQRYTYNNIVQEYNTMRETIPSNIVGGLLNMSKMDYLELGELEVREVKF